jgi:hypothetical protein
MNRNAETHALLDRAGEGMETASRLQVSRARCRRCRADGYERRKVAHRFTQQRCHTCNACLATHALHVWHARPGCLAKHASHAVIAPCFSAQKAVYLRKQRCSVRYMSRRDRPIDDPNTYGRVCIGGNGCRFNPSRMLNPYQRDVLQAQRSGPPARH